MTIETVLTDEQIAALYLIDIDNYLDFARAIEQAVLQSPEIQRLRECADRYNFARDPVSKGKIDICISRASWDSCGNGRHTVLTGYYADVEIDAAMKGQK